MEISQAWFPDLEMEDYESMTCEEIKNLYDAVVNVSFDSYSSENITVIDQSFQTQQHEIKPPEPLVATTLLSSKSFTISFGNLNPNDDVHQFPNSLGHESAYTTKVPKDHVFVERKRREKLNQLIISLSTLLPNQKKMDKASILEGASSYIKELQDRVNELEGLSSTKRKLVQECFISMKRSRIIINSDDEYSWSEEKDTREGNDPCISPEIEVRKSGSSVLVRIQCQKNISSLVNTLTLMQKLGLSIISSSTMPFAKTTILITVVAQVENDFCITAKDLVKNLQLAI